MRIPTFYSSIKRFATKLDEKLAIRILCLYSFRIDALSHIRL